MVRIGTFCFAYLCFLLCIFIRLPASQVTVLLQELGDKDFAKNTTDIFMIEHYTIRDNMRKKIADNEAKYLSV